MAKLTVTAAEYKEHHPVTTEGTIAQAVKAFLKTRGLDGLNLHLHIVGDDGKRYDVTQTQCADLMTQHVKDNPAPVVAPEPIVEEVAKEEPAVEKEHPAKPHHKK